jgi:SSS family solute:Na+ symporter
MLLAAVSIGVGVPHIYFGGIGPMFSALARAKPAHLVRPGATNDLGDSWYISTVLLSSLGFYRPCEQLLTALAYRTGSAS